MNDLLGLWFGFIGIVVGAIITFVTEIIVRKGQMKFDMSKEVRKTLMELNDRLVKLQNQVLHTFDTCDRKAHHENIILLKAYHWEIMDCYKTYRIHLGDLKAYELNSAIFEYYYKQAVSQGQQVSLGFSDYMHGYTGLKNAVGLMINAVRFELVKINQLKKIKKVDIFKRNEEYLKYAYHIDEWLKLEEVVFMKNEYVKDESNFDPVFKAIAVVINRIEPYLKERMAVKVK